MTMRRVIFAVLVALLVASCSKFDQQDALPEVEYGQLRACFAEQTRTYVEGERFLRWHERDELSVFYGNAINNKYRFNGKTGDSEGTFALILDGSATGTNTPIDHIYALYPRDVSAEWVGNGTFRYNLPTVQYYLAESFGQNSNAMVAVTEGTSDDLLMFKNICGYLKVQLYGDATIKSMTLQTNAGEKISGLAYVTAEYGKDPAVSMAGGGANLITLNCGDGVVLSKEKQNPTDFWFVVPPTTFSEGITVTATDVNGKTLTKSTSSRFAIGRNALQPMEACECNLAQPETPETPEPEDPDAIKSFKITYRVTTPGNVALHVHLDTFYMKLEGGNSQIVKVDYGDGEVEEVNYLKGNRKYYAPGDYDVTIYYKGNPTGFERNGRTVFGCNHMSGYPYEWYDCVPIVKIEIPETFEDTGMGFYHLEEITFIGDCAMLKKDVSGLVNGRNLAKINSIYASEDGRFLIRDGVLLACARAGAPMSEYVVPEGVHTIAKSAFNSVTDITKIVLPSTLKTIGDYAFASTNIDSIVLPEGFTTLGSSAFRWSLLKSIEIPSSVKSIGAEAFRSCESMTTAVVNCSQLGEYMFQGCYALADIALNGQPRELSKGCFASTAIQNINVPSSVLSVGDSAFVGCKQLQNITFAEDSKLVLIEESAFSGCKALESIHIPSGVTSIGDKAFDSCDALKSVTFGANSKLLTIGYKVFEDCTLLEQIELPEGLRNIPEGAFYNCSSLVSAPIPSTVTYIDSNAFANTKISEIRIPDSVTTIGPKAFYQCGVKGGQGIELYIGSGLRTLDISALNQTKEGIRYMESTSPEYVLTEDKFGLFSISNGSLILFAGLGCPATEYVVPQTIAGVDVKELGRGVFCSSKIETIDIPQTVTAIREYALMGSISTIYFRAVTPAQLYTTSSSFTQGGFSMVGNKTYRPMYDHAKVYVPVGSEQLYIDKHYQNVEGYDYTNNPF